MEFQIKNVARMLQPPDGVEAASEFDKDAAHPAKEPRALKAQVLAVPHPLPGVTQHAAKPPAPQRMPAQRQGHFRLRVRHDHPRARLSRRRESRDAAIQRQRVIVQRRAFQFQFIETAVAELCEVIIQRRAKLRRAGAAHVGRCACAQRGEQRRRGQRGQRNHAARRFGADDAALLADEIIGQPLIAAPFRAELAQHAVPDHGEEIIHQRRIPARQQPALEIAIVRRQFIRAHLRERLLGERGIEPDIERTNLPRQRPVIFQQPQQRAGKAKSIAQLRAESRGGR